MYMYIVCTSYGLNKAMYMHMYLQNMKLFKIMRCLMSCPYTNSTNCLSILQKGLSVFSRFVINMQYGNRLGQNLLIGLHIYIDECISESLIQIDCINIQNQQSVANYNVHIHVAIFTLYIIIVIYNN